MYAELLTKLAVVSGTDQYTAAVSMEGANAVQVDAVIYSVPAGATITFDTQGSNDMQNWTSLSANFTGGAVGFFSSSKISSAWRYSRVHVSSNNATASIVSVGLNTSAQ